MSEILWTDSKIFTSKNLHKSTHYMHYKYERYKRSFIVAYHCDQSVSSADDLGLCKSLIANLGLI